MNLEDVLDKDYGEAPDEYELLVEELADALGLKADKAKQVAEALCELIRYELSTGKEKKSGITVVLGS